MFLKVPSTKYAQSRNGRIAYQQFGTDARQLLYMPGAFNHLDFMWSDSGYAEFLKQLGSFAHVVAFDRLGVGLSDRLTHVPPLEERIWEVQTVLDAVGFEKVSILALSENAAVAAYYAAANPTRVTSIVCAGAVFKGVDESVPWALPAKTCAALRKLGERWGEGASLDLVAPSIAHSRTIRRLWGSFERAAATPSTVEGYVDFISTMDLTSAVKCINVPALVIARKGDRVFPAAQSRKLAELIEGAAYVELEGDDHVPWFGDLDSYVDAIERFLTGEVSGRTSNGSMATLLFTDIVNSTVMLSRAGDAAWVKLIAQHDAIVRELIEKYDGLEIERTGDGFLIIFPGPLTAVRCVLEMMEGIQGLGIELRAGIHTGEVVVYDKYIQGIAVNTCARICSEAGAGEVLGSGEVRELLADTVFPRSIGLRDLKGVGKRELFLVGQLKGAKPFRASAVDYSFIDHMIISLVHHAPSAGRALMGVLRRMASSRWRADQPEVP